MKKLGVACGSIIGLILFAGCAHSPSSDSDASLAHQTKVKTDMYFENAQWSVASSALSSDARCAIQLDQLKGKDWKALVEMSNACVKKGNWSGVEMAANELARTEINAPWGVYYLSLAAEQRKDYPRALWMIDSAIQKTSSDAAIFHFQKGRVLWQMKKYETALNEVQASVRLNSHLLEAQLFLADVAYNDLDYRKAKEFYSVALGLDGQNERAQKGLSNSRVALGEVAPQMQPSNPRIPAAASAKEGGK
jgi:tetratricopeptide (TPR) repeat protein